MDVGVIVPQGWTGEYDGWDAERAWARTVAVAEAAEDLGFESIWLFDHVHTTPRPTQEITFEASREGLRILPAKLGADAGAIGAARSALVGRA